MMTDTKVTRAEIESYIGRTFARLKPDPELSGQVECKAVADFLEDFNLLNVLISPAWTWGTYDFLPSNRRRDGIMDELGTVYGMVRIKCRKLAYDNPEHHGINLEAHLRLSRPQNGIGEIRVGLETNKEGKPAVAKVEIYAEGNSDAPAASISFKHMENRQQTEIKVTTNDSIPSGEAIRDVVKGLNAGNAWGVIKDTFVYTAGLAHK